MRKPWIKEGLLLYLKRLPGLSITELRDSTPTQEAKAIRNSLKPDETLIVLTEEGQTLSSLAFAKRLQSLGSCRIAFVIGGADGITNELKTLASWSLSLSLMTFPHEVARLLLVEQIYRAQMISKGSPYHRK